MRKLSFCKILLIVGCIFVWASHSYASGLGKIEFKTSGAKAAQPYFVKGVLLLHNFQYGEARENFIKAEKLDSDFAMAYWGESMTYNHPLWDEQDLIASRAALNKFAPTSQERFVNAKTAKEKGLLQAAEMLFGVGTKQHRDNMFTQAMSDLYKKFTDDDEIASFYALALLGSAEGGRDIQVYMQAAAILEEIDARNPLHPGVLHYSIHCYDDPTHAPLGLRAARAYAKAAPGSAHAAHMPSHIFLALGMWDEVIASNQAGWDLGVKEMQASPKQQYDVHALHALHWLSYGYMQKKDYKKAYQLVKTMEQINRNNNTPMAKWYYALMRADYYSESQDWLAELAPVKTDNIELSAQASNLYINALLELYKHKDINAANKIVAQLELLGTKKAQVHYDDASAQTCGHETVDYFTSVNASGIKIANIIALELKAQIAQYQQKNTLAIQLMQQATALDDSKSISYGPPVPVKLAHELLGDIYFSNKDYLMAYHQYFKSLQQATNRELAEIGLEKSAAKLKQVNIKIPEKIKPYFHKLMIQEDKICAQDSDESNGDKGQPKAVQDHMEIERNL